MIEFVWLKNINFYPPKPDLSKLTSICLGTKSRALGDSLMLTTLPEKIKRTHPHLTINSYPRAFNPVVLKSLPQMSGISFLPDDVYGDECNYGSGHIIQLKEQYFGLPVSENPKPTICLSNNQKSIGLNWIRENHLGQKPIAILHPTGKTREPALSLEIWEDLVKNFNSQFDFVQIGLKHHKRIPGCKTYLFTSTNFKEFYRLSSVIAQSDLFIGVDSGPMHIARAFEKPSLIFTKAKDVSTLFERRKELPYFLGNPTLEAFLYEDNVHIEVDAVGNKTKKIKDSFEKICANLV